MNPVELLLQGAAAELLTRSAWQGRGVLLAAVDILPNMDAAVDTPCPAAIRTVQNIMVTTMTEGEGAEKMAGRGVSLDDIARYEAARYDSREMRVSMPPDEYAASSSCPTIPCCPSTERSR